MRKTRVRTGLFAVLTAMWMLLIFLFSAQDASKSGSISDNFSRFIVNFLEPGEHVGTTQSSNTASSGKASGSESVEAFAPSGNSKTYDPVPNKNWFGIDRLKFKAFIRKSGHFCLFMGLGALVLLTLRSYYSDWPEQKSVLWRVHLSAWLACGSATSFISCLSKDATHALEMCLLTVAVRLSAFCLPSSF